MHCDRFDEATGHRSPCEPYSRVRALTELATKGDASAPSPCEVDAIPTDERRAWALEEIAGLVAAELTRLRAHRATLDHARFDANRAEVGKRAIQSAVRATGLAGSTRTRRHRRSSGRSRS